VCVFRTSCAFAVMSAAVALRIEAGAIAAARIALADVALKPWRARAAEAMLAGTRPDGAAFHRAAEADRDAGSHIGRGWYAGSCAGPAGFSFSFAPGAFVDA
jgi:CO/xanthine dehydrogenase FAD-binding subunit